MKYIFLEIRCKHCRLMKEYLRRKSQNEGYLIITKLQFSNNLFESDCWLPKSELIFLFRS